MLVDARFAGEGLGAVSRTRGVCGREGAASPSWFSSSARMSCSLADLPFAPAAGLGFAVFLIAVSSPMPSKSSPSSSSVGAALFRLLVMV